MKRIAPWILAVLLIGIITSAQISFDSATAHFNEETKKEARLNRDPVLPSLSALEFLGAGKNLALADIIWIQTIQYFGGGNPYGEYAGLSPALSTVTNLDPKYSYPYQFGLIVLPFMKQTDHAIVLGEKAQKEVPNDGLTTYYLATVYHLEKKDYKNAAKYYQLAAKSPDAPTAAQQLAGISLSNLSENVSDRLVSIAFWQTVFQNADDPDEKERAKNWANHMELVYQIELSAQDYKAKNGGYPQSLGELVQSGYFTSVPRSPIDRKLILDPKTGRVNFDTFEE